MLLVDYVGHLMCFLKLKFDAEPLFLATHKPLWSAATARRCYASPLVAVPDSRRDAPSGEKGTETAGVLLLLDYCLFSYSAVVSNEFLTF